MAHGATLDSHELSFLRDVLKSAANGRINVEQAVECVEQMDFLIDGDIGDLVKSVVPDAFDADALSLQDVVKVATAAKAQEGTAQTSGLTLDREDSLTELQNSFHQQMVSGEIPEQISQGPPPPPPPSPPRGVNRDDSLAQLEMSFNRQVMSGDVPEPIAEGVENGNGRSPVFGVDVPQRRRSVAGGTPTSQTPPPRRDPFRSDSLSAFERPFRSHDGGSPILVDLPHRRTSIATRPGGSILIGVEPGGPPVLEDDDSTLPASPEFARQTSEEELLDAAGTLGLDPVQASNVPQKRRSFVVSQGWEEAAAQDSAAALSLRQEQEKAEAEAIREREEAAEIKAEVEQCLVWLADEAEQKFLIAEAREEGKRLAAEAAAELARAEAARARAEADGVLRSMVASLERDAAVAAAKKEAERVAAETAAKLERAEGARSRIEVESVLNSVMGSLERDAAVVAARKAAELKAAQAAEDMAADAAARVSEEAAAREAAERSAKSAAALYEEAVRSATLVEEAAKEKENAAREAALEAEELAAAERAKADEDARLEDERRAEAASVLEKEVAEREARLIQESADREAEARDEAQREAQAWKGRFEEAQKERKQEAAAAAANAAKEQARAVAAAVEEAREFEKRKVLALRARPEDHRRSVGGTTVSYEDVNHRQGSAWWQCLVCAPNVEDTDVGDDDEDYAAAVDKIKPEMWIKSDGKTASTRSVGADARPSKGDVCTIM